VVLPTILGLEQSDSRGYSQRSDALPMAADESSHARLLSNISQSGGRGMEGGRLAQLEGRHRAAGGNALRAAVLGANDGLVSNLSLVMGVAGAALASTDILITGLAGLLAGAISMALGEWLSVQSSRELYRHQIGIERAEIAAAPEEEAEELALIYQSRGVPEDQARQLATQLIQDQDIALETLAREELSVDPQELGGSAWEAALTSFFLFAMGAILPVFPFIFLDGMTATHQRGFQHGGLVHHRGGDHPVHRAECALLWRPPDGLWPGCCRSDLPDRSPDRYKPGRLRKGKSRRIPPGWRVFG
jgi:VIT1/CCC1 family predicted Fe2+/Mn2+ transporter